jgi:hypothetical protein
LGYFKWFDAADLAFLQSHPFFRGAKIGEIETGKTTSNLM